MREGDRYVVLGCCLSRVRSRGGLVSSRRDFVGLEVSSWGGFVSLEVSSLEGFVSQKSAVREVL